MNESNMFVLDPTGKLKDSVLGLAPRPADLEGKTVGLMDNGLWWSFGVVLERYKALLKKRYGVSDVIYVNRENESIQNGTNHQDTIEELASKVDVAITGLGN